jgi:glycosyltransferase involved in cell wall biosynthesis
MLQALVDSLGEQTLDRERFEVVIVDDASREPAAPQAPAGLDVRVVRHDQARGPAAARNTGWHAARGRLIAFTDDDCAAAPNWLEALLEANGGDEHVIVQGATEPADGSHVGPLTRTMHVTTLDGMYETCNVAYPRDLLATVGGFDERLRRPSGEDVELAWRALAAGGRGVFAPEALVLHAVHEADLWSVLRATMIWTDSVAVLKRHPQLRSMAVARVFWKPSHPLLLVALAGGWLGARRRSPALAAAAATPWTMHHARRLGGPVRGLRWLPAQLAIDLTELGTAVAGSIRHRTLIL